MAAAAADAHGGVPSIEFIKPVRNLVPGTEANAEAILAEDLGHDLPTHYVGDLGGANQALPLTDAPTFAAALVHRQNAQSRQEIIDAMHHVYFRNPAMMAMLPGIADAVSIELFIHQNPAFVWRFAVILTRERLARYRNPNGRITNIPIGTGRHEVMLAYTLHKYVALVNDNAPRDNPNRAFDLKHFLGTLGLATVLTGKQPQAGARNAENILAKRHEIFQRALRTLRARKDDTDTRYVGFSGPRLFRYAPKATFAALFNAYMNPRDGVPVDERVILDLKLAAFEANAADTEVLVGGSAMQRWAAAFGRETRRMVLPLKGVRTDLTREQIAMVMRVTAAFGDLPRADLDLLRAHAADAIARFTAYARRRAFGDARADAPPDNEADAELAAAAGARSVKGRRGLDEADGSPVDRVLRGAEGDAVSMFTFFKDYMHHKPAIAHIFYALTGSNVEDWVVGADDADDTSECALFYALVGRDSAEFRDTRANLHNEYLDVPVDPLTWEDLRPHSELAARARVRPGRARAAAVEEAAAAGEAAAAADADAVEPAEQMDIEAPPPPPAAADDDEPMLNLPAFENIDMPDDDRDDALPPPNFADLMRDVEAPQQAGDAMPAPPVNLEDALRPEVKDSADPQQFVRRVFRVAKRVRGTLQLDAAERAAVANRASPQRSALDRYNRFTRSGLISATGTEWLADTNATRGVPAILRDRAHHIDPLLPLYAGTRLLFMCAGESWQRWGISDSWMPRWRVNALSAAVRRRDDLDPVALFDRQKAPLENVGADAAAMDAGGDAEDSAMFADGSTVADRALVSRARFDYHFGGAKAHGLGCVLVTFYVREAAPVAMFDPHRRLHKYVPRGGRDVAPSILNDCVQDWRGEFVADVKRSAVAFRELSPEEADAASVNEVLHGRLFRNARERMHYHYTETRHDKYGGIVYASDTHAHQTQRPFLDPEARFRQGERLRISHREVWDLARVAQRFFADTNGRESLFVMQHPRIVLPDALLAARLQNQSNMGLAANTVGRVSVRADRAVFRTTAELATFATDPTAACIAPRVLPSVERKGAILPDPALIRATMMTSDFPEPFAWARDGYGKAAEKLEPYLATDEKEAAAAAPGKTAGRGKNKVAPTAADLPNAPNHMEASVDRAIRESDPRLPYFERAHLTFLEPEDVWPRAYAAGGNPMGPNAKRPAEVDPMFFTDTVMGQIFALVRHAEAAQHLRSLDDRVGEAPPILHLDCVLRRTHVARDPHRDGNLVDQDEAYVVDACGPMARQAMTATGTEDLASDADRQRFGRIRANRLRLHEVKEELKATGLKKGAALTEEQTKLQGRIEDLEGLIGADADDEGDEARFYERPVVDFHAPLFRPVSELDLLGAHPYGSRFCTVPFWAFNVPAGMPADTQPPAAAENNGADAFAMRVDANDPTDGAERRSRRARWLLNALCAMIGPVEAPPAPVVRLDAGGKYTPWDKRSQNTGAGAFRTVVAPVTFRYDEVSMSTFRRSHLQAAAEGAKSGKAGFVAKTVAQRTGIAADGSNADWRADVMGLRSIALADEMRYTSSVLSEGGARKGERKRDTEPPERSLTCLMRALFTHEIIAGSRTVTTTTPFHALYRHAFRPHNPAYGVLWSAGLVRANAPAHEYESGKYADRVTLLEYDRAQSARNRETRTEAVARQLARTSALSALDPCARHACARIDDLGYLVHDGGGVVAYAFVIASVLDAVRMRWTTYSATPKYAYLRRPVHASRVIVAQECPDGDVQYEVYVYRPRQNDVFEQGSWRVYLYPDTRARREARGIPVPDLGMADAIAEHAITAAEVSQRMDRCPEGGAHAGHARVCYCALNGPVDPDPLGSLLGAPEAAAEIARLGTTEVRVNQNVAVPANRRIPRRRVRRAAAAAAAAAAADDHMDVSSAEDSVPGADANAPQHEVDVRWGDAAVVAMSDDRDAAPLDGAIAAPILEFNAEAAMAAVDPAHESAPEPVPVPEPVAGPPAPLAPEAITVQIIPAPTNLYNPASVLAVARDATAAAAAAAAAPAPRRRIGKRAAAAAAPQPPPTASPMRAPPVRSSAAPKTGRQQLLDLEEKQRQRALEAEIERRRLATGEGDDDIVTDWQPAAAAAAPVRARAPPAPVRPFEPANPNNWHDLIANLIDMGDEEEDTRAVVVVSDV